MRFPRLASAAVVAGVLLLLPALARAHDTSAATSAGGAKADLIMWLSDAEDKLNQLAEAMPEKAYTWRPDKEVRTVADVFMHVAAANYGIPTYMGAKAPEGFDFMTYEKSKTKKADIQKALKESFVFAKAALSNATDEDMEKQVEIFGMKMTYRSAYLMVLSHAHEHLGQSIAYARSNKVVPPWTAMRQAQAEKK